MTSTTDWLSANSSGNRTPGVSFKTVGDKIVGKVISTPRTVETEFGQRLVIELEASGDTDASSSEGAITGGELVSLWVKPGAMATALRTALTEAKVDGIAEGDTLAFQYTGDGEASKPGWNPPKQYRAKVQPARPAVGVDDLL
jgi:hypothetical protein